MRSLGRSSGLAGGTGLLAALSIALPLVFVSAGGTPASSLQLIAASAPATMTSPSSYSATWSSAQPAGAPPPLRGAAAAYDGDTSSVVLFGGIAPDGNLSDSTWVWDGRTWTLHPASAMSEVPPARQQASMAFDPSLHQLILFGGEAADGSLLGDTWAWNGASWYELTPGPSGAPAARRDASLSLGPNGNLVLFGGIGSAPAALPAPAPSPPTTTTTSTTTTTTRPPSSGQVGSGSGSADTATTAATPTPATGTHGQATAGNAGVGAAVLGDTWQWTVHGWAPSSATGPAPRWGAALAYDSADLTTVLFSGDTAEPGSAVEATGDTWLWNGSDWSAANPRNSPPARFDAVTADDPAVGGVLLATGNSGSAVLSDTWLWSGSDWIPAGSGGSIGRTEAAGAYDAARSDLVVFGGAGGGGSSLSDTELVTVIEQPSSAPTTASGPTTTSGSRTSTPDGTSTSTPSRRTNPTTTTRPATTSTTAPSGHAGGGTSPGSGSGSSLVPGSTSPTMALQTSLHDVRRGATVRLAGSGFQPGASITISFHSAPSLVGHTLAGPLGDFTTTVAVPRSAAPGEHHFVATGLSPDGKETQLVASVFVLAAPGHEGTSVVVKVAMVALALLIPAGAWGAMTIMGWRRRRSARSS